MNLRNLSIKQQLVILVISVSLVPILLSSVVFSRISSDAHIETISAAMRLHAIQGASYIDDFLKQRTLDVKILSQADVFEGQHWDQVDQYLTEITKESELISDIDVVNLDGVFVASSEPFDEKGRLLSQGDLDIYRLFDNAKAAAQGDVFVSEALTLGDATGVIFATPLTDDSNTKVISVLLMEVHLDSIQKRLSSFNNEVHGFLDTYLVDNDGFVVVSSNSDLAAFSKFPDLESNPELLDAFYEQGRIGLARYFNQDNNEVLAAYADMSEFGKNEALDWSLISLYDLELAAAAGRYQSFLIIVVGIILVAVAAVFAVLIGRRIVSPLKALGVVSESIQSGDLTARATVGGSREMTKVANSINTMLDKLVDLNASLEQTVETRTTELEQSRNQLIASEKLASLGALVAGISHEVNTPIGISVTVASTLQMQSRNFVNDIEAGRLKKSELQAFLNNLEQATGQIMSSLERASDLIQSFKQVSVDQTSDRKRTFNVKQFVQELYVTLHYQIKNKPIQVNIDIPEVVEMRGYPGPLGQVLTNLFNNSLLHGLQNCKDGVISISLKDQGDYIILTHQDNGSGIPEERLDRIFDPFYTSKEGQGGSGLGLSIIRSILHDLFDGEIEASNKNGAVFQLTLIKDVDSIGK